MVARKWRFVPLQMSERLDPPLTLCRAVAVGVAVQLMTTGESVVAPTGRQWGRQTIKQAIERARKLTGEPNRKGYNQSHIPAFLAAFNSPCRKDYIFNKSRRRIRESLQNGYAVTLAGNVGHVKGKSKLKRDVNNVAHEMIFWDWQGGNRTGTVSFIDGMTPQGSATYIRRVPVSQMFQFASAFGQNGVFIAERWKVGEYTAARQQEKRSARLVLSLQKRNLEFRLYAKELDEENDDLVKKYNALEAKCKATDGGASLVAEQQALALMREAIGKLKQ